MSDETPLDEARTGTTPAPVDSPAPPASVAQDPPVEPAPLEAPVPATPAPMVPAPAPAEVTPGQVGPDGLAPALAEVSRQVRALWRRPPEWQVIITGTVLEQMRAQVLAHPNIETAWGLYGLVFPDQRLVMCTGVLVETAGTVVKRVSTAEYGGATAAAQVQWLQANYALMRRHGLVPEQGIFTYIHAGHSHHQLGFNRYSQNDIESMQAAVRDDGLLVALGPLATITLAGPRISEAGGWGGGITITDGRLVEFKFYLLTRDMWEQGFHNPVLVTPEVVAVRNVPLMPPPGWQFVLEEHYTEQLRHLRAYGCTVDVVFRDVEGGPPMEVQFLIGKSTWRGKVSIVTPHDFPYKPATIEVIGFNPDLPAPVEFAGLEHLAKDSKLLKPNEDFIEAIWRLGAQGRL